MELRKLSRALFIALVVTLLASPVLAHRIIADGYVEDKLVVVETTFGDGTSLSDAVVKVFSKNNELVHKGETNEQGIYKFKPQQQTDLKIIAKDKFGHQAQFVITKEQFVTQREQFNLEEKNSSEQSKLQQESISKTKLQSIVKSELEKQLKPVHEEMKRLQQESRPGITEIIGGLGYIFGLMGLFYYFKARKDESS